LNKAVWKNVFPFLQWWPLVNQQTVKADLLAGITGAIIVLPQGVAFALIAGLPPVYGMYTAMVTPIIAALFGSSRHMVSGPTTAISLAVFSSVSLYAEPSTESFISLTLLLTFLTGVIQFSLGLARMGALVNFISHSVVIGFTAGAAVLIATTQLKHVLGLHIAGGASFMLTWQSIVENAAAINPFALSAGIGTLLFAILLKKFFPQLPNLLLALIVGTLAVYILRSDDWSIALVGAMPRALPSFTMIHFNYDNIAKLTPSALTVAILGLIEAVAIARSIGSKTHQRLDNNQEFIGQGLSNMVGGFFSCYAGSGSFTRSGLNYTVGAKTPLAAVFAALMLVLIVLAVAPLTAHLPMATVGGIILLVAWNLIDFNYIKSIFRTSKSETSVLLITFISTVFIDLVFAISTGIVFSLVLYLMRTSKPKVVKLAPNLIKGQRKFMDVELHQLTTCPQLHIIRVDGSLFFGAVENIRKVLYKLSETKPHILIIGNGINFIDVSGAELLEEEAHRLKEMGGGLYLSHLKRSVREFLDRGYREKIGNDHFFYSKEDAISYIYSKLDANTCKTCTARIFNECKAEQP
jgi:sulfate permease, SulP family